MRPRLESEGGATMLEFAIAAPIVILLIVGMVEFGFGFVDLQTVASATTSGARVGSAFGPDPLADDIIQDAVSDGLSELRSSSTVEELWIYQSNAAGDVVDVTNTTNKYVPDGGGGWTCDNGCPWDPATRTTDLSSEISVVNRDYLGVRVIFRHDWVTGLLPIPDPTWTDDAVVLIEPVLEEAS